LFAQYKSDQTIYFLLHTPSILICSASASASRLPARGLLVKHTARREAFYTQIDCQPHQAGMNSPIPPRSFASQSVPGYSCFLVLESLPFFTPEGGRVDGLYPSNCCGTDFCPVPDEIAGKSTALLNLLIY